MNSIEWGDKRKGRIKRLKPGGFFARGEVEFYPLEYEWVNKKRREIICNTCEGTGDHYNEMYGFTEKGSCTVCDGTGTVILKKAKKEVEE